ncbi:MAG: hypothetical protein K2L93_07140 [Muribaculaceae bacterium]|nr:hypothetical protein [Muribaculaceae bacterium]
MDNSLKYKDATDRCYGVTGMAISIVALDAEELLDSLTIEEGEEAVKFTPEYYFSGNPRYSARLAWNQILQHFSVTTAMAIGNLMCRQYVLSGKSLSPALTLALKETVASDGREACQLDDDEIDSLFNRNFNYLHRLFSHSGVQSVARDFATTLSERRTLTRADILDELRALSLL